MMRLGVAGAAGRMGRALVRAVVEHPHAELAAALTRPGDDAVGLDAGALIGAAPLGVKVGDDPAAFEACEAVLDFTTPALTAALAARLPGAGVAHVIGTTGLSEEQEVAVGEASQSVAVVKSGNMSLGVNLLAALVLQAAKALPEADVEILEMHHKRKVDAPSGTALLLGEAAASGRGVELADRAVRGRDGHVGPRPDGAIGFAVLRGGSVVGTHDVILALSGEHVVLRHVAEDRAIFANGAVHAALWLRGKPPGLYTMADVLQV